MEHNKKWALISVAEIPVTVSVGVLCLLIPYGTIQVVLFGTMMFSTGLVVATAVYSWRKYTWNRVAFNWDEKEYDRRLAERMKEMKAYWRKHRVR